MTTHERLALERAEIYSLRRLAEMTRQEIRDIPGIGKRGFREILELMSELRLSPRRDDR